MTKEEFEELPRDKRWSYSRIMSFISCPRKHYYTYVEEIRGKGNIYTDIGTYWHETMQLHNLGEDPQPQFDKFSTACLAGEIEMDPDTLQYVYNEYLDFHKGTLGTIICAEEDLYDELEDGDWLVIKMDAVYERDGINILKDYKTTIKNLKYSRNAVKFNQQILLYAPIVEDIKGIIIHGVEIDEVRIAKCISPPLNQNGKPTTDIRKLGLVKYDTYYNLLDSMGLASAPEYQSILTQLEKRGHPLFNRVTVDLADRGIMDENLLDIADLYKIAKSNIKSRKRSVLCDYCDLSSLCEADFVGVDEEGRQFIIDKITQ